MSKRDETILPHFKFGQGECVRRNADNSMQSIQNDRKGREQWKRLTQKGGRPMRYNSQSVGTIIIVMLLAVAIPFTMGFGPLDQLLEKKDESKEKKDTSKEGTKEGGSDSILGTIGGAVGGAAVGAGVGGAVGGKKGAIIGGAVGAVAGAVIGNYVAKKIRGRQATGAAKGEPPRPGILLTVGEV